MPSPAWPRARVVASESGHGERGQLFSLRVRVHSNAVRRTRQAGCGRSLRIALFSCRMSMWREAGWHPKCRLFAARVPSPCAGTILRLKRVITSTVLQVFAVALEQSWEPRSQLASWLLLAVLLLTAGGGCLTGVGSSGASLTLEPLQGRAGDEKRTDGGGSCFGLRDGGRALLPSKKLLRTRYKNWA